MRNLKFAIVFFALLQSSPLLLKSQVYTFKELDKSLSIHPNDSLKEVELLASLEFHKLLNEYRVANNLTTLDWSNAHWLASANHNVWMVQHNNLDHYQSNNKGFFTGKSPGDRLKYVVGDDISCHWTGENCLYNFSSGAFYTKQDKDKHAKAIAKASFNQWKGSPGHNANMLGERHKVHGVAFKIDEGKVWATNLFGGCSTNPNEKNTYLKWKGSPNADYVIVEKVKKEQTDKIKYEDENQDASDGNKIAAKKLSVSNIKKNITALTQQHFIHQDGKKKFLSKAAQKHATYLIQNGLPETNTQIREKNYFYASSPKKRIRKASSGTSFFVKGASNPTEEAIVFTYDWDDFEIADAIKDLQERLKKIENSRLYSYGIDVKRKKNVLSIAVVILQL